MASIEEAAEATIAALRDPVQAAAMARAGKEHVRAEFLTPRYLRDHLRSYRHVLKA